MAQTFTPRFVDLVRNYTMTVGTGNFVLGPPVIGHTSFATAIQPGESFYYSVIGFDKPGEREVGRGTMEADRTIKREPIAGALTSFTGGTKTIALIAAAEWFEKIEAGGSTLAVATRPAMAAVASPASGVTCDLREAGREGRFVHMTDAEFAERYGFPLADAVAADTLQGMYVATPTGAWVREGDRLTPFMFGGQSNYKTGNRTKMVPPYGESATPGSTDGILINARAACQAMLDMVAFHKNRELIADFSGGLWGIAKRGDGDPHDLDGLVIDQPAEYARRFIGGEFRGIGSGRHLIYVDEGSYSRFEGNWHVRSGADGGSSYGYPIRQWETGIWLRNSGQCRWETVKVSGFKRWGIEFDPEFNAYDYNNNIGARFARVYGNNNGSACDRAAFNVSIGFTASVRTGAAGGIGQRTELTLGAGHDELRVDDIIRDEAGHYHVILEKVGNVISVFPWILSTAATGTITSCHGGAMRVRGKDVAGAGADHLCGVLNGATLDIGNSLHGTEWGNVIQEGGGLGTLIGTVNGANLGHTIAHMHSEGNSLDLLSVGLVNTELLIGACSAWAAQDYNDPFKLTEVLGPNDGVTSSTGYGLPQVSSRAARGVGKIWADGKLLRGAAGDFKVKTGFRFYTGDEDQPVDPLIASVGGIDRAPAFRGVAVAMFEDLQLAEFGNRIPFLTFEIIGDDTDPTLGDILRDASGGAVDSTAPEIVRGYAAYGPSRRAALDPLIGQFGVPVFDDGDRIRSPFLELRQMHPDEVGCGAGVDPSPRSERLHTPAQALPRSLALSYYDPARDYQTGQMRASGATSSGVDDAIELPVVMDATQAKGIAQGHIARRWAQRDKIVLRLPPCQLAVEPGALIALDDGGAWRVEQSTVEEWVVKLDLSPVWQSVAAAPADGGAHVPATDLVASPTEIAVLDLPDLGVARHDVPAIYVAACQPSADWRSVPIEVAVASEVRTVSSAPAEAIVGSALTALPSGQSAIFDLLNSVDVELADPAHWLESRDDDAVANGANLASLGAELFQFGVATPLGGRRFRLNKLLRGRRGTEWAMNGHAHQERFTLLHESSLQRIELPMESLGSSIGVSARGLADDDAAPVSITLRGEALRPPSPVHLLAVRTSSGELQATWVRRSRSGWSWLDGTDVALGESTERYRIRVEGSAGSIVIETIVREAIIGSGALAPLGSGPLIVSVVQVGDYAESHPASTIIS